jgi:hypothetical protein
MSHAAPDHDGHASNFRWLFGLFNWINWKWLLFFGMGTVLFGVLDWKVGHFVHIVTGHLPPPPPPIPLHEDQTEESVAWPGLLTIFAAGLYLAWHHRPGHESAKPPLLTLVIFIALAVLAWFAYYYWLYPRLTYNYRGHRYTIGYEYTPHGVEYAREHDLSEVIEHHAGKLFTVWSQSSVNKSTAILAASYCIVCWLFLILFFVLLETLLKSVFPRLFAASQH